MNPRMMKEVFVLSKYFFEVSVIYTVTTSWAHSFDKKIIDSYPNINWIKIGVLPEKNNFIYLYHRLFRKINFLLFCFFGTKSCLQNSLVLYSKYIINATKKIHADLYIGHNLGSLPAIILASQKYGSKSIFDFEDYHRGESDENSYQTKLNREVEKKYIPLINKLTAASPAITEAYKYFYPGKKILTINNVFPLAYAIKEITELPDKPLKLFWFSQFIGKTRGLENVIKAMSSFYPDEIILTLLGSCSREMKNYFLSLASSYNLHQDQLVFLNPVEENEIFSIASQHHMGLASEYSHNINRDLCLTNKIFTYLLAGNALVLSDTYAQKSFLNENPGIGLLYKQNSTEELTAVFKLYLSDSHLLQLHRQNALNLAKTKYNWDIEQNQFLDNVKSVLTS
jgi:glycosyltransferase involved in cell wall biosynthesis